MYAEKTYETVGRRFTFLPLSGFSSDDGLGGGFRLAQFNYDGKTIPYARSYSLQGFFTVKGKWAHQMKADYPEIAPGNRLEIIVRLDKEDTASFAADLTDQELAAYTKDEQTFRQVDAYAAVRWIHDLSGPWRLQLRFRGGSTTIDPFTTPNVIGLLAPLGHEGGWIGQVAAAVRYDTRDDYVNSKRGVLEEIEVLWGVSPGGDFNGGTLTLQHRHFKSLPARFVFAQRYLGTYTFGDIPFYGLPKLGSSRTLRGLSADRFRDHVRLLTNTELRWLGVKLSQRHHVFGGLNFFADVGQVFPRKKWPSADGWETGHGLGVRLYWYSTVVRGDFGRSGSDSALYMRFAQIF